MEEIEETPAKQEDIRIGFALNLKERGSQKTEESFLEKQKVMFSKNLNSILIGVNPYGQSPFHISFNGENPELIINKKLIDIDLGTPDNKNGFLLKNIEIDSENNITISADSLNQSNFKSIKFYPKEIIVTKNDKTSVKIPTEILDIQLPTNIFNLITDNKVTTKNLPSPFIKIVHTLSGVEKLEFNHKKKLFTILKTMDKENPTFYISHKNKLINFETSDIFVYLPEETKQKGLLAINTNKSKTTAHGIRNLSSENVKKIASFIENKNPNKIKYLSQDDLETQIAKPKALQEQNTNVTKFSTFTKHIFDNLVETPNLETEEEITRGAKVNNFSNTPNSDNDDDNKDTNAASDEQVKQNKNKSEDVSDIGFGNIDPRNVDTGSKEPAEEINDEKTTEKTEELKDEAPTTPDEPKPEKKEEEKKEKTPENEPKTEDLSDLAKMFGLGLFLFGLFTGFGGLLLTILATGIGGSAITLNKKFKAVKAFPSGSEAFEKELKKAKEKNKVNIKEKSTTQKECKIVDELLEKNVISETVANKVKETIESHSKSVGFVEKTEKSFAKHLEKLNKYAEKLESKIERLKKRNNSTNQEEQMLKIIKDGVVKLEKQEDSFKKIKERAGKHLEDSMNAMAKHSEASLELHNLQEQNIDKKLEEGKFTHLETTNKLRELTARKRKNEVSAEEFERQAEIFETQISETAYYNTQLRESKEKMEKLQNEISKLENEYLTGNIAKAQAEQWAMITQNIYEDFAKIATNIAEQTNLVKFANKVEKSKAKVKEEKQLAF
jgi:hypothetical protein